MSYGLSSRFQERRIDASYVRWHTGRSAISIEGVTITLTAMEYRLLYPLRHGVAVSYIDLAAMAYGYEVDEKVRVMIDKHIDRIRRKLRGTGIYIYCVLSYGYLLLPEIVPDASFQKMFLRSSGA